MTSPWRFQKEPIEGGVKLSYFFNNDRLSYSQVVNLWNTQPLFAKFYTDSLIALPYQAIRWESPPLTQNNLQRPYQCVAINAPELIRPANPYDFQAYFSDQQSVVSFTNLGGDATLIVPCGTRGQPFAHLLSFLREADHEQSSQLWQTVGEALAQQLSDRPLWLSTSGDGVAWLHIRFDSRPKYYCYKPYLQLSFTS